MDHDDENTRRWNMVKEQLITLWVFNKKSPGADEFHSFLTDGFTTSCLSLSMLNQICYFLLGLINRDERDKLIKWPVINIQGQAKFRKGISSIVKDLIVKYPFFNLKKLPESYLVDPNHNQKKILEFILRLSNLAIYLAVNDDSVLVMSNRSDLNANEIETAMNLVRRARICEEKVIKEHEFPCMKFENVRMNITKKCVAIKQENHSLNHQLNKLKKDLIEKGVVKKESDCKVSCLQEINNQKLEELKDINRQLAIYSEAGKKVLDNVKAAAEPNSLSADDLGLKPGSNLYNATSEAYDNLYKIFEYMKSKEVNIKEKEEYYKDLQAVKKALLQEQNALQSFICKCSTSLENLCANS